MAKKIYNKIPLKSEQSLYMSADSHILPFHLYPTFLIKHLLYEVTNPHTTQLLHLNIKFKKEKKMLYRRMTTIYEKEIIVLESDHFA